MASFAGFYLLAFGLHEDAACTTPTGGFYGYPLGLCLPGATGSFVNMQTGGFDEPTEIETTLFLDSNCTAPLHFGVPNVVDHQLGNCTDGVQEYFETLDLDNEEVGVLITSPFEGSDLCNNFTSAEEMLKTFELDPTLESVTIVKHYSCVAGRYSIDPEGFVLRYPYPFCQGTPERAACMDLYYGMKLKDFLDVLEEIRSEDSGDVIVSPYSDWYFPGVPGSTYSYSSLADDFDASTVEKGVVSFRMYDNMKCEGEPFEWTLIPMLIGVCVPFRLGESMMLVMSERENSNKFSSRILMFPTNDCQGSPSGSLRNSRDLQEEVCYGMFKNEIHFDDWSQETSALEDTVGLIAFAGADPNVKLPCEEGITQVSQLEELFNTPGMGTFSVSFASAGVCMNIFSQAITAQPDGRLHYSNSGDCTAPGELSYCHLDAKNNVHAVGVPKHILLNYLDPQTFPLQETATPSTAPVVNPELFSTDCSGVDVLVSVDQSRSIGSAEFKRQRDVMSLLLDYLPIGPDGVGISLTNFGLSTTDMIPVSSISSAQDLGGRNAAFVKDTVIKALDDSGKRKRYSNFLPLFDEQHGEALAEASDRSVILLLSDGEAFVPGLRGARANRQACKVARDFKSRYPSTQILCFQSDLTSRVKHFFECACDTVWLSKGRRSFDAEQIALEIYQNRICTPTVRQADPCEPINSQEFDSHQAKRAACRAVRRDSKGLPINENGPLDIHPLPQCFWSQGQCKVLRKYATLYH